jgi:hypothetical protein
MLVVEHVNSVVVGGVIAAVGRVLTVTVKEVVFMHCPKVGEKV